MPRLADFRTEQLAITLAFLRERSPFYRPLLDGLELSADSARENLGLLPVMTPTAWSEARTSMRTGPLAGAALGYTRGTTGSPAVHYGLPRELEAVTAAFGVGDAATSTLVIGNLNHHGMAGHTGFPQSTILHPLAAPEHFEQIARLLKRADEPFSSMPAVGVLSATTSNVKALTVFLLRRGIDPASLGIERIIVGSNILTEHGRAGLERWWGAPVRSEYGFSEMRACNASECEDCGYFHLPPTCIGEVLAPGLGEQLVAPLARGLLAVTGFYPFIELEPRVRYVPGDVVQIAPVPCPRWGEPGFLPLGRAKHSAQDPATGAWICPRDVLDALGDLLQVNRMFAPGYMLPGPADGDAASPRFLLTADARPHLRVEMRASPIAWPAEAAALADQIRSRLGHPAEITVCEPGTLGVLPNY